MATLISEWQFTGSLGSLTAYSMRGTDKILVRTKGGPSRQQIKNDARFVNVRKNNAEFGVKAPLKVVTIKKRD